MFENILEVMIYIKNLSPIQLKNDEEILRLKFN